jgi:hypothetical protein
MNPEVASSQVSSRPTITGSSQHGHDGGSIIEHGNPR